MNGMDEFPLTPREELELLRLRKEERYLRDFVEPLKEVEASDERAKIGSHVQYRPVQPECRHEMKGLIKRCDWCGKFMGV